jgi:hypothetical protein
MARRIGMHMKQSGQLKNYEIHVKYHDGVATLEGDVASAAQRQKAIDLTKSVKGVSRVDCKLAISSESKPTSEDKSEGNRYQLAAALDEAAKEDSKPKQSNVVHAYPQQNEAAMMRNQRTRMMSANGNRMSRAPMQRSNMPRPAGIMPVRQASATGVQHAGGACPPGNCGPGAMGPGMGGPGMGGGGGGAVPTGFVPHGLGRGPSYDNANMPGYAWPSYASYPNYAALSYPQQYSPTAWPYIGPFYPYPQVPLAWRKVSLEWDDGWWFLDFSSHNSSH